MEGVAETATLAASRPTRSNRAYLLVIEDGSSSMYQLPNPGVVTVGRIPEVEIRVDHASVSRRHARILVDRGEIRISDLDSHNGTRVNGMRVDGSRVLMTGDVIAIGEVLLVVHAELDRELSHVILDEGSWRRRLAEETQRAVVFQRPLAVLAIVGAPGHVTGALRAIDVVGQLDDHELLALLPEADPTTARQLAEVVLEAVRGVAPEVRIGIASCPFDATDPDNLILAARAAAVAARAAGIAMPQDAVKRVVLGERQVLVCHPAMARVFELLQRLAKADLPVLIIGETGVGKENAAFAVHHYSERRDKPFVALNCAALPEGLVESQLFGHDKGAFTGATSSRAGLFETASGGTLFLDEIGELALPVQAKLLRALETKRVTRVGETTEREVDLRVVAATHRELEKEVKAQRFREDLYFRLGAACVHLLPLRDRRCEIPMLFREFIANAAKRAKRTPPEPVPMVVQQLLGYEWPGNVRELKNVAEFVTTTVEDDRIEPDDLPPQLANKLPQLANSSQTAASRPGDPSSPMRRLADELEEIERQRMTEALTRTSGVKTKAAAMLGMPIRTFNMKIRQYGL
jgi:two-component system, NtrC family, response regulator AtoC